MATTIKLKNSVTTTNTPTSLAQGEVAINITDKKVWVGNAATTPIQLLGAGGSASFGALTCTSLTNSGLTSGRVTYATTAGLLTDSANLTFNGTTLTAAAITSTGVATFSAGTVSAPAITTTGDTNTGIFFPAADTIAFTEGGVESMRIDSSGNVSIGATSSSSQAFRVSKTAFPNVPSGFYCSDGDGAGAYQYAITRVDATNGRGFRFENTLDGSNLPYYTISTGTAASTIAGMTWTERMRITSGGSVGVNATSPALSKTPQLFVRGDSNTSDDYIATFEANNATAAIGISYQRISSYDNANTAPLIFDTNGTERMRITSGGSVVMGGTAAPTIGGVGAQHGAYGPAGTGAWALGLQQDTTSASGGRVLALRNVTDFNNTGNEVIYYTGNTTARFYVVSNGGIYNYQANNSNLSDRREKTNIAPAGEYLSKICAIPVQTFNYIDQNMEDDAGTTLGVIAQDVQSVAPELVTENNWGTQEEPKMRLSIYQTDLQYALMKCIQEQQVMIEELKQEVAKLKGV